MGFASGFQVGWSSVTDAIKKREEREQKEQIRKIMEETPITSMVKTPTYEGMTGSLDEQDMPTQTQQTTQFLGKTVDGTLTDAQVNSARNAALLNVIKQNDPLKAMQFERENKREEQADFRFQREKKAAEDEDAFKADRQNLFKNSRIGQLQAEYNKAQEKYKADLEQYEAKKASGESGPSLGLPPSPPQKPRYEVGDRLSDMADMFEVEAKYGRLDMGKIQQYGDALDKLRNEGYGQALKLAQSGASIQDVAKAFNSTGQGRFDPSTVVSDEVVKSKNAPPTRVIKYRDENGELRTINTLAELDALDKADKTFTRYFQQKTDARADSADARAAAQFSQGQADRADAKSKLAERTEAAVALYKKNNPTASAEEIQAVRTGILEAVPKLDTNAPSEVKLAKALVDAGVVPNMEEGLRTALTKKGQSARDTYLELMKPSNGITPNESDIAPVMEQTFGPDWRNQVQNKRGATSSPAPAAKPKSEPDAHMQAREAIANGASKEAVNARLKEMGFKPL